MSIPKIVLLDIETSPIYGLSWGVYKTDILKILEPVKIISCAWKHLEEEEVFCKTLVDYPDYQPNVINDELLVKDVWKVLDEADIVIAHYGDAFDLKVLNAKFVAHGLNSPSTYKSIDSCKAAKKFFKFDSNKLDNLAHYLNVGSKAQTGGFSLWTDCMSGNKPAWEKMREYNKIDVVILEKIYLRLRPFIENHPNLNIVANNREGIACASCLSTDIVKRGFSITSAGRKQRYQCSSCGSWSTGSYKKYTSHE